MNPATRLRMERRYGILVLDRAIRGFNEAELLLEEPTQASHNEVTISQLTTCHRHIASMHTDLNRED